MPSAVAPSLDGWHCCSLLLPQRLNHARQLPLYAKQASNKSSWRRFTHTSQASHERYWLQVPNIKFNVAKMLERLVPLVDASVVQKTIKPCLLELQRDSDVDVRFFAGQALGSCDAVTAA